MSLSTTQKIVLKIEAFPQPNEELPISETLHSALFKGYDQGKDSVPPGTPFSFSLFCVDKSDNEKEMRFQTQLTKEVIHPNPLYKNRLYKYYNRDYNYKIKYTPKDNNLKTITVIFKTIVDKEHDE